MKAQFTRGSACIYHGPSEFDSGVPIVALATGLATPSGNVKTGKMVQVHICRADIDPAAAIRAGLDAGSVCPADCPYRSRASGGGGGCYTHSAILRGRGTAGAWRAWEAGRYREVFAPEAITSLFAGRDVRLGSYGDPAALPPWLVRATLAESAGNTGYSHAWQLARAQYLRAFCMASVGSAAEAAEARAAGWRAFLVEPIGERMRGRGVAQCPSAAESPAVMTCSACPRTLRCAGTRHPEARARVIRITAHGSGAGSID